MIGVCNPRTNTFYQVATAKGSNTFAHLCFSLFPIGPAIAFDIGFGRAGKAHATLERNQESM